MKRLKRILTTGENAVLASAQEVASAIGTQVWAKMRVVDALEIDRSGISSELYSYALRAHFDTLLVRDNLARMAIEFDGPGHNA